jgi:hypothetical protein
MQRGKCHILHTGRVGGRKYLLRRRGGVTIDRRSQPSTSEGVVIALAGPDTDHARDRRNPDLAVADLPGAGGADDSINDSLDKLVVDQHLDTGLRDEIDLVLGSPIDLGVPALPSVALDFGNGQTKHTGGLDGMLHGIDREGLHDRGDQLHGVFMTSIIGWLSGFGGHPRGPRRDG